MTRETASLEVTSHETARSLAADLARAAIGAMDVEARVRGSLADLRW